MVCMLAFYIQYLSTRSLHYPIIDQERCQNRTQSILLISLRIIPDDKHIFSMNRDL
jgi:hypothetical protein